MKVFGNRKNYIWVGYKVPNGWLFSSNQKYLYLLAILTDFSFYMGVSKKHLREKSCSVEWLRHYEVNRFFHEDVERKYHSSALVRYVNILDFDYIAEVILTVCQENHRCIYENEDVLVEHFIAKLANGTREEVLWSF